MIILFPIIFIFGITISYLIFSQSGVDRFWVVYLSLSIYILYIWMDDGDFGILFFSQIGYRVFLWTWTRFVIVNNKIVLFLSFMGYIVSPIHWRQISYANLIFLFFRVRKRKKKIVSTSNTWLIDFLLAIIYISWITELNIIVTKNEEIKINSFSFRLK